MSALNKLPDAIEAALDPINTTGCIHVPGVLSDQERFSIVRTDDIRDNFQGVVEHTNPVLQENLEMVRERLSLVLGETAFTSTGMPSLHKINYRDVETHTDDFSTALAKFVWPFSWSFNIGNDFRTITHWPTSSDFYLHPFSDNSTLEAVEESAVLNMKTASERSGEEIRQEPGDLVLIRSGAPHNVKSNKNISLTMAWMPIPRKKWGVRSLKAQEKKQSKKFQI